MDTRGVRPLRSIRDESDEAEKEGEITLDTVADALAREKVVGKHYKRIRRGGPSLVEEEDGKDTAYEKFDVFGGAIRRKGNYFVVDHGSQDGVKKPE